MKIATVGYLHGAGGAERQIVMLSNELSERHHDVYLIVLADFKSHYKISNKVNIINLTNVETKRGLKIFQRYIAFRKALKTIRPQILISFNVQPVYFCALLNKSIKGRVIYSERGDPYDKEYAGFLGLIRNISFKKINGFVFQSEGARDYFSEKIKMRSTIIHNSVSLPKQYEITEPREKRIVSIGRLHPQKNIPLLIDAFIIVHNALPEYKLDIYGDGILRKELQNKIKELALDDFITIYHTRDDIYESIYKASLFVLTSDYEGMPNALLEAMALGLPCIATDCRPGGARSLITNGENGYIVPRRNVEALANQIIFVLCHKNIAEFIANNATDIVNTHSNKATFDKWNNFLIKIANE